MTESERFGQYQPRSDIAQYVERDEAEKKLLSFIEQQEIEKRQNTISSKSIEDSYAKGKDAANKQDWTNCISFIQKAVNDYNFYVDSFIYCRHECDRLVLNSTLFAPEHIPGFKYEEQIIRQSFCLSKCIDDENRASIADGQESKGYVTASQTLIDFEKLTPYEYLLFCYDKVMTSMMIMPFTCDETFVSFPDW